MLQSPLQDSYFLLERPDTRLRGRISLSGLTPFLFHRLV